MIKKYLPLFLIPLVSSCSLLGGARDFDGMYKAHMRAQVESLRDVAETLGIGRKMTVDGSTKVHLSVPGVMSGVLSSEYTSKVDGKNVEFMARNLMMAYEALIASGSVNLDTLGITTHEGDTYFRYENFRQSNMLSPDMFDIFGRYDKQWLSLTKKEVSDSFSGASTDDILSYRLSENLSSLTLDEVDEFLTKYPVLKETKDLGLSGNVHMYEVMLDVPETVSLLSAVSERLTGSGYTDAEKESLTKELSTLSTQGTVGFVPGDAAYMSLDLSIKPTQGEVTQIKIFQEKNKNNLTLSTGTNTVTLSLDASQKDQKNLTFSMTQDTTEIVRIIGNLKYEDTRVSEVNFTFSSPAQGLTATLLQKNAKDGSFEGNLNIGVGSLSWKGKVDKKILTAFHLQGAVIGQTVSLDLEPKDSDMLGGTLVLKEKGVDAFTADVGLRLTPERFSLAWDMPLTVDTSDSGALVHFDADIIAKRSELSGKINIPGDAIPLKNLTDELEALEARLHAQKPDFFDTTYDGDTSTLEK